MAIQLLYRLKGAASIQNTKITRKEGYNGAEVYLDLSVGELSSLNTDEQESSH